MIGIEAGMERGKMRHHGDSPGPFAPPALPRLASTKDPWPMFRVTSFLMAWTALAIPPAGAQDWVASAFPERSFEFGTVARGSKLIHAFKVLNRTNQEIHIADYRTKCGCTQVRLGAREIP